MVIFCKSYINDLSRVLTLIESISKFNVDAIPFFLSVPEKDYNEFSKAMIGANIILLKDEDILISNPKIIYDKYLNLNGKIQQQIVKSEFWRICPTPNYLCIDSDSFFIKNFKNPDFIDQNGTPFTTISEAHQLLDQALDNKEFGILNNYFDEMKRVKEKIARSGRVYAFGPTPVVWNRDVWESLEKNYLIPNGLSILDAIEEIPYELCWYGEALLKYQAIPLLPVESFFKVYHYKWQFKRDHLKSPKIDFLKEMYLGMVLQSNWKNEKNYFLNPSRLFNFSKD